MNENQDNLLGVHEISRDQLGYVIIKDGEHSQMIAPVDIGELRTELSSRLPEDKVDSIMAIVCHRPKHVWGYVFDLPVIRYSKD